MDTRTGQTATTGAVGLAERRSPARARTSPRRGPRPVPVRDGAYDHLSLADLRAYRTALQDEEGKVSYWRRILQARLDVVRAGSTAPTTAGLDPDHLRPVLTDARTSAGRSALISVVDAGDIPPLPRLAELWDRRVDADDAAGQLALETDLTEAEDQLSSYRHALHGRLAGATDELIARYREQPLLCLTALPLPPTARVPAPRAPRGSARTR
ncbi:MAG: hypothetical protein JWN57_2204 [Frankiales bacterium]|jgi:hypothetical protein|nr:hypothetical protein [Frankiales bacterium]